MNFGTLVCGDANGSLKLAEIFMNQNTEPLAIDTAHGQGESHDALS